MTKSALSNVVPVTDSPWFWVLIFALCGVVALLAVSGKYGRRQAGIERKFQARQQLQQPHADNANPTSDPTPARTFSDAESTLIPLWPLAIVLCAVAGISAVMLGKWKIDERRRRAKLE